MRRKNSSRIIFRSNPYFKELIHNINLMDQDNACSICLDKLPKPSTGSPLINANYIILDCSHQFHKRCIHQWRQRSLNTSDITQYPPTCPLCRQPILSHIITTPRTEPPADPPERAVSANAIRIIKDWSSYISFPPLAAIDIPILLMSLSSNWIGPPPLFMNFIIYLCRFILLCHFVATTRNADHHASPIFCSNPLYQSNLAQRHLQHHDRSI